MTEHTRKIVELAANKVEICLTHWQNSKEEEVVSVFVVSVGCSRLHANITPAEARELAAALMLHADEVDEAIN